MWNPLNVSNKFFFLLLILFHSDAQFIYLNEEFVGSLTNGSMEFPFNNLSEVFSFSSKVLVNVVLLSNVTCNSSLFNNFGLSLMYFLILWILLNLPFRGQNSLFSIYANCELSSVGASLSFQNLILSFKETMANGTPFKVSNQSIFNMEVSKKKIFIKNI